MAFRKCVLAQSSGNADERCITRASRKTMRAIAQPINDLAHERLVGDGGA